MEGHFESDKQGILQPPAYTPDGVQHPQQQQYPQVPATQTVVHVALPQFPPDYFALSIIVTIFCCIPFGIVALVKSSEVRTRAFMGDAAGAELSSSQAKRWSYAALFTGISIYVTVFVIYLIIVLVAATSY